MVSDAASAVSVRTSGDLETTTSTFGTTSQDALDLEGMSLEEIEAATNELLAQNGALKSEMAVFERYAAKFNIQELLPPSAEFIEKLTRRKKRNEPKREKLKIEEKIEIVNKIADETTKNIQAVQDEHESKVETLECKLEQLAEQAKDIQKHGIEFEREFGKMEKGKRPSADKYTRFCTERLTTSERQVGKLKLKRQAMKDQQQKVNLSLKQKEETGDTLLAVDFQQLQIENAQFLERIDIKNKELIHAKLKAGKAQASLQKQRKGLQDGLTKQKYLTEQIATQQTEADRLVQEIELTHKDVSEGKGQINGIKEERERFSVPGIFPYIAQAGEHAQLEHEIAQWKRKVQIQEGKLKSLQSQRRRLHQR